MSGPNSPGSGSGDNGLEGRPNTGQAGKTGDTEAYSQAYSAPESEHVVSGPYVPVDPLLYDYDNYTGPGEPDGETGYPRWPWVVGVTAIIAAIALVSSVALLVARTKTTTVATPDTTTATTTAPPPVQDEITTTKPPPLPPPTSEEEPPPPPPPPTSEEEPPPPPPTSEEEPPPPPPSSQEPSPEPSAAPPPPPPPPATTTPPPAPRQVTYSITGTKAAFDQITITYVDASGQRRTQRNAYIPWSLTLTPISQSEVGSVEASSLLKLSKLNCSITSSDGTVLSSNANNAPQVNC